MTTHPDHVGDRYGTGTGAVLLSGMAALVRGPVEQVRSDRADGYRTAAFISGYQGSPLGGYDRELARNRDLLDELGIVHRPGLNEELAATAVMGSQVAALRPTFRYDGVIGYWYGKAPGLERAGDAIRHAQYAGTSRRGGVVAFVGDDPSSKSSTLPSRSDSTLAALGLPVLAPADVQDMLDLSRHAVALSRRCGLWVAVRIVTAIADSSALVDIAPDRPGVQVVTPRNSGEGSPASGWAPALSAQLVPPHTTALESEVLQTRLEAARQYVAENALHRLLVDTRDAWLGIVCAGHDAVEVMRALARLGVTPDQADDLGIRVLALLATHPLDIDAVRSFAAGLDTILVVEDKKPTLEDAIRSALYDHHHRPRITGRTDHRGAPLIPVAGSITAERILPALHAMLTSRVDPARLRAPDPRPRPRMMLPLTTTSARTPYLCSGCPHSTSTRAPDDALVAMGIGCHGLVRFIPSGDRGELFGITQMGGEGSQWLGIEPFVDDRHLFQNIGDGTFFHSGQLSVQAAVAAGAHITFKLLYNSGVAMTGGQDAVAQLPVPALATKLLAEGVTKVAITTDNPSRYRRMRLPRGVTVHPRDQVVPVQESLRATLGVTVLIHDQQCAVEKRRDIKRGKLPAPATLITIDQRVCEGCGDCGVQSNCLSLHPIETPFGTKTTIDQTSCNHDTTCLKGDCPAFVTVRPASRRSSDAPAARQAVPVDIDTLPQPSAVVGGARVVMPGIGGTGVVTTSQILATAAAMDGQPVTTTDQTGLSQKGGPVRSTMTIGMPGGQTTTLLLAFDLVTAVQDLHTADLTGQTVVVASTSRAPVGATVGRPWEAAYDTTALRAELDARTAAARNVYVDAAAMTSDLIGNAASANVFLVGVAHQHGLLPLSGDSIEHAIATNGIAVQANLTAYRAGRRWASNLTTGGLDQRLPDPDLNAFVAARAADLVRYLNRRYADRYLTTVQHCWAAETIVEGTGDFTRTVAHHLHRVMAYKDEYEVAALLLLNRTALLRQYGPGSRISWNLHPPLLRAAGVRRKLAFGPWTRPLLAGLAASRRLRGTAMDPFGHTSTRRTERRLITHYEELVRSLADTLSDNYDEAVRIAGLIDVVRGYEHVKARNIETYRQSLAELGRDL